MKLFQSTKQPQSEVASHESVHYLAPSCKKQYTTPELHFTEYAVESGIASSIKSWEHEEWNFNE